MSTRLDRRFLPPRLLNLAEYPREPVRPLPLPGLVDDQVLADFDASVDQSAHLALDGDGVVGPSLAA